MSIKLIDLQSATICLALLSVFNGFCEKPELSYSGRTSWCEKSATLTFTSSGSMPETKEGFYWDIPENVSKVVINKGVTVSGGFRIGYRPPSNPLHISGIDRKSSIIFGTAEKRWSKNNSIPDNSKWRYGAINVTADATVYISNLTTLNPRAYHISGYARNSVIHVDSCDILDTRGGSQNNSDGFIGSAGSSIRNSLISTLDDGIKIYHDITIENVRIEQHRNGAAIQFGWGREHDNAKAVIRNLTITGVNPEEHYNMAPFTWKNGVSGIRNLDIKGLKVRFKGKIYNRETNNWNEAGLFKLNPQNCTLNFYATNADLAGIGLGECNTKGSIQINATNK